MFFDVVPVCSMLEEDLLLIMTHYIEKDQMLRNARAVKRPSSGKRTLAKPHEVCGVHVIFQCWPGETWFQTISLSHEVAGAYCIIETL